VGTETLAIVAAVLAFIAVAGVGFAFAGGDSGQTKVVKRAQLVTGARARDAKTAARTKAQAANDPSARRKQILKTLREQEKQAKKASVTLPARLRQAGLSISPTTFWVISGVLGLAVGGVALFIKPNPLIALGFAFAAALGLPRWVVGFLGKRRTKKFTENFSDAIDIIVRGIKSGLPVHDCLKIIAKESPDPLGGEFKRLVENIGLGVTVDQSLEKMYERMPTAELKFFSIVLNIQQKTGGNLAEALGNLSTVLRSRKLMREKIKALSAEAVTSAGIIGCLPPGVVGLISFTSPSYMSVMYTDPRGNMMLGGGLLWMCIGIFVMKKMINFKF
jgi:tight adherence protein B